MCHYFPRKEEFAPAFLGAYTAYGAVRGVVSSAARCHLSMSFDTPWYGRSGEGERSCSEGLVGWRSVDGAGLSSRLPIGGSKGLVDSTGALRGAPVLAPVRCCSGLGFTVEGRDAASEFLDTGDTLPFAGPGSSTTARLALGIDGDAVGESCGKRVAAAEGEGTPEVELSCDMVLTLRPKGLEATGGATPGGLTAPLMASNRCTMSDIDVLREVRRDFSSVDCSSGIAAECETVDSRGAVLVTGLINMDWGRARPEGTVGWLVVRDDDVEEELK